MSSRHRHRESSVLPEDRPTRKAEHRRVRRNVNQALHVAALAEDTDDLVLDLPHHTHGYREDHDAPLSHDVEASPAVLRHWKLRFWKRRSLQRRRRAVATVRPESA
ncbi:MAG: hypothetical protein ACKO5A_00920 [Actinomycetota bacterium]